MKKGIFVTIFLIGLLLVNSVEIGKSFKNNSGIQTYNDGSFSGALDNFSQSGNDYNLANTYYKLEQYTNALEIYENLEPKNASIYHNIGNTHYAIAKQEKMNIGKRLKSLRKALSSYKKSLKLEENTDTLANKEIVEEEIKQLEEALAAQEEEKKNPDQENEQEESAGNDSNAEEEGQETSGGEEEQEQESGTNGKEQEPGEENNGEEGEDGTSSTESDSGEQGDNQEEKGESGENGESEENQQASNSRLSEEQQAAIDKHTEKLEEAQGEFGQYYNKTYKESQSRFDSLFGVDPFFDNDLLNTDNEKKDW